MKIVVNRRFGGFSLSQVAFTRLCDLRNEFALSERAWRRQAKEEGDHIPSNFCYGINRTDPQLIQVITELGEAADGGSANLKVVEIPDDVDWILVDHDGREHIAEKHRTW